MKEIQLFVEGEADRELWQALLADVQHVQIVAAGGRSRAPALARRALMEGDEPVILVLDADTTNDDAASMEEGVLRAYLAMAATGDRYLVELARPEIESIFFGVPEHDREIFGKKLSSEERVSGRFAPKLMMEKLLARRGGRGQVPKALGAGVIDALRRKGVVYTVHTWIKKTREKADNAARTN